MPTLNATQQERDDITACRVRSRLTDKGAAEGKICETRRGGLAPNFNLPEKPTYDQMSKRTKSTWRRGARKTRGEA